MINIGSFGIFLKFLLKFLLIFFQEFNFQSDLIKELFLVEKKKEEFISKKLI